MCIALYFKEGGNYMFGQGTFNDPYLVKTVEDFQSMGNYDSGVYFELANDIDFGTNPWGMNVINTFKGIFDGKFYKLKNFTTQGIYYIIDSFQGDAINQCVFKNVGIENINIDSRSTSSVNPPLGTINGPTLIEKVYVTGTITNTVNDTSLCLMGTLLRGIDGYPSNTQIRDCYSFVDVNLPYVETLQSTSGVFMYTHQGGDVQKCCFFGTITLKPGYNVTASLEFSIGTGTASGNYVDKERSKLTIASENGVTFYTTAQAKDFVNNYPALRRDIWGVHTNIMLGYPHLKEFNNVRSLETTVRSNLVNNGYQDIRNYVQSNWTHVQLSTYEGVPIVRLPVTDERLLWTHVVGSSVLELTISLQGTDSDLTLPVSIGRIGLYKDGVTSTAMTDEPFTPQLINVTTDRLKLIYQIQVPKAS